MILRGKVWKFGNDVDTDVIIPVQHTIGTDLEEFGKHCMKGLDPHFAGRVNPGDIMVAGTNFGCGSSREPAPLAIKASGISCVIAKSFARIFYRNAINVGLPLLECDTDRIEQGDEIEVDLSTGVIRDKSKSIELKARPLPKAMLNILNDGGLLAHIEKHGDFKLD